MAISKKSFVNLDLQGNALVNPTIGLNSNMTKEGSFQYNAAETRLEYFNGTLVEQVANLTDISAVTGGLIFQGGYDPTTNTPDITVDNDSVKKGFFWVATAAGTFLGETVQVGDSIIAKQDNPAATAANWLILQGNVVIATDTVDGIVRLATQTEVNTGTEGGAVVLTPATFAASQQLADINTDITNLENDKLARDGSQAMTGSLDMGSNDISNAGRLDAVRVVPTYIGTDSSTTQVDGTLNFNANGGGEGKITNLPTPTNGGDATNKTYVDGVGATAESNANTYTDTQIAAQSASATLRIADWELQTDGPFTGSYRAIFTHNFNSPNYSMTYNYDLVSAEFLTYSEYNDVLFFSNSIPSFNVYVQVIKVTPPVV